MKSFLADVQSDVCVRRTRSAHKHAGPPRVRDLATRLTCFACAVDGGERAVMFDRFSGVMDEVYGEGTWLRIPWLQTPHVIDIRTRPRVISSVTGTGDLQMVNISLRVLSRPDSNALPWIFKVCSKSIGKYLWHGLGISPRHLKCHQSSFLPKIDTVNPKCYDSNRGKF